MFKVCLVLALAVAGVAAQEVASAVEAAPEPYSYGYSTDTHSAQEQRDPSGTVTGSYMLVGDDGRERRVEYIADAAGFRAKVATNEVGTKSESPADVELIASEPTPQQLAYVASPVQQQVQYAQVAAPVIRQQVQQVQRVAAAPAVSLTTVQQPLVAGVRQVSSGAYYRQTVPAQTAGYGYGYYPGYGYNTAALNNGYYGYGTTGVNNRVVYGSGYGSAGYGVNQLGYQTTGLVGVGNYNNHLPSQYYRSVQGASVVPAGAAGYTVGTAGVRYVNQPAGVTTTSSRTVGVPTSNLAGSSNYLVLQKRSAEAEKAKSA